MVGPGCFRLLYPIDCLARQAKVVNESNNEYFCSTLLSARLLYFLVSLNTPKGRFTVAHLDLVFAKRTSSSLSGFGSSHRRTGGTGMGNWDEMEYASRGAGCGMPHVGFKESKFILNTRE